MKSSLQTAQLQLAKQSAQDHPEDQSYQEKVQEIRQEWDFILIINKHGLLSHDQ